jgi:hypothetical protein
LVLCGYNKKGDLNMNTELLLKVRKHILAKPSRLRMSTWIVDLERLEKDRDTQHLASLTKVNKRKAFTFKNNEFWNEPANQAVPDCGTVGCIAGWTCILAGFQTMESLNYCGPAKKARELLDISISEANVLFYITEWPSPFKDRYLSPATKTAKQRAKIVADRIDHFIKHHSEESAAKALDY